ncbi:MAG: hypothetical protein RLZZ184_35 [Cyanobacteriota bacterium]|jgi:tape measure domain-containing protein
MNLGELIVELSADSSELEKTLERAKKKAYEAAVSVEKSFENINLNVGVDDDSLVNLNKHLNLKVQHLKEVNKYFNNNPIVVNVDDSSLTDLNEHLNLKVQHLKQVNKYFDSNPIKVNTDTKSLDELEERLGGLSSRTITITVESDLSKQLEKSLADAVKNAVKEEMSEQASVTAQQQTAKEASSPNKVQKVDMVVNPGRAIMDGIFGGLGKGFTDGINRGIEDAVGVDIPTMTRITSNMMLRYFGVGKKAQSDPKNEQKRVEAILKDGIDAFVVAHDHRAAWYQGTSNSNAVGSTKRSRKKAYNPPKVANDVDVDFEATGQVAAKGLLRYFGIGKKAQSDPKNEQKRVEAILRGMVDDYVETQTPVKPSAASQFLTEINNQFVTEIEQSLENTAQRVKSATIGAVRKGSQNILANSSAKIQNAVNGVFNSLEGTGDGSGSLGGKIGSQIVSFAKQSVKSTTKTILPNTYGVVSEFLKTGTINTPKPKPIPVTPESELKQAASNLESATKGLNEYIANVSTVSTDSGLSQAAISLENAAQSLNNAVNTLNNSISAINLIAAPVVTQAIQSPVEQPLNIPVNIPRKSKKPQPELELVPIETTASQVPQQLKQHFETIKTNTLKNIDLSKQYVEATARENGEELVPLEIGKSKKSDEIKVQKEISLENVKASFKAINNYFSEEYKKLKIEVDQTKKTGTPAEIKATKEKLKKFILTSNSAIKDIDNIVKQAEDAGFDKKINSDLSKVHAGGKSPVSANAKRANEAIGKLNTEEKSIFDKQLAYYAPLAQQLGIDIDAGLAKGVKHGSDGVSDTARQMLDDLIETVEAKMKIQSPSLVMFEIGMMIASGLFLGMQKGNSKVAVGARQLVSTVKDAVGSAKEILEPALAVGGLIPGMSTAATYGSVGLAASDSGLKMLDKVGERHAANPEQTLFQSAFESGKDFVAELRADKTLTKPREAFDHFINLSKAGAATFGVSSFTAFDAAQSGMTALLRSGAIGKAVAQSHGETKTRLAKDPSLDYMAAYKAVLTEKLKDLKLTKPEIIKAIGSALKVVPTGFGTAANSVTETAGTVFADGIDALTIPRDLYRNIVTKAAKGATHQQAIAESITDLGAPTQVADAIGSFGDKHSVSLNAFARMSGNVVENINRSLINTVAASSKVVSASTNAVSNQVKKNMGHLPSQQPISKSDSRNVSSAAIASDNTSSKPFTSIGGNIMKGLGKGMADSIGSVTKVMDNAGNSIQSRIKQNMGISSPSKVMIALGLMIASGLAVGIKKGVIDVSDASAMLAGAVDIGIKELNQFNSEHISNYDDVIKNSVGNMADVTKNVYDKSKQKEKRSLLGSMIGAAIVALGDTGILGKISEPVKHLGAYYQGNIDVHKIQGRTAREAEIAVMYRSILNYKHKSIQENKPITAIPDDWEIGDGTVGNNISQIPGFKNLHYTLGGFNYNRNKEGGLQINDVYDWSHDTNLMTEFNTPFKLATKFNKMLIKNPKIAKSLGLTYLNDYQGYGKLNDKNQILFAFNNSDPDSKELALGDNIHSVLGGKPYIQSHTVSPDKLKELQAKAARAFNNSSGDYKQFAQQPEIQKYLEEVDKPTHSLIKLLSALKKDFSGDSILGNVFNSAKSAFSKGGGLKDISINFISSFAQGFISANGGVLGVVTKFAKGILSAIKKVFRIASPSGEGIDVGENIAGSMGTGIDNQSQSAVNAARNMAENIRNAIADPWDTPLPANPVFQQDLDLENQAQAHIKATKEHFQKLKIQDLLSNIGVNFGADFEHEGIASNVLSSSDLLGYLNNKSANLTPLQSIAYNRLVDDFQEQKTLAAHHFAIARTDGNPVDPAVLRGLDAGFNSILLRIVEFSKRLGIKGQSIDKLLASNRSVVNTAAYQPPRFVAPKTPIPERQPGQTDQEYSQAVKRALAEDNNNYRKARNAYNRMILGVSNTPTPKITQLPALPPVPVYAREIIEPVTNVPPVQRTQATIPSIPDPWNDSVEQLVNTVKQATRTQFLLPPAKEHLNINSFVQTQSNLSRLAKEIVAQQPMTQLSKPQSPTIQRTSPIILPGNFAPNPNAQIISSQKFTPKPDAQILYSKNFAFNPNAQIVSSQKFTPKPDAQLILPVVQGLSPAIRSTHSLAQNSISALIAANKQIQATIAGNKVTVSSRFAPIPDPWTTPPLSTPPLPTQTVKQLSKQMTGQYGPIPDSWLTSSRSTQAFKQVGKLLIGQIPVTLSSTIPSFIPQPTGTATPKYVFPPQTLGTTVPTHTFPVNPTPTPPTPPTPPIPPTLLNQYLSLGTDLVTNIFNAVSTSIRQSTLSGYASLGQVMRNAVNAALFSLADTLKQPLHQALLSQTRSILPWFLKFIPRSFQLLPKLSFAIPFVGGMVLRLGNSIVKNLLENNILKKGGFLTNLLSSITKVDLSALSGTKTAGVAGFLEKIINPLPFLIGSQISPLSLGLLSASPLYDAFSGILGLDKSVKPNPKKQAPTIEKVLQDQTKINREKALLRDFKEVGVSTNTNAGVGQNLAAYPDIQRTKTEELLKRAVESGKAIPKLDELTRKALRERGVNRFARNQMDSAQLLTQRENILKNPLNATSKERDFLLYTADMKNSNAATLKKQEKRIISILKERGKSDQDIENIRKSGTDGLFDVGDDLIKNLPTITKQPTPIQTVQPRTSSASIASKELVENLGNTLLNSVLNSLDVPVIPKSVIQGMIGRKMGEKSATIADAINAFGVEKSKVEQLLTRNLESGNTKRLDGLTKQVLRERGVTESVRNAMTPEELAAAREKITKSPVDLTARERKLLKFMGDFESYVATMGNDVATRKRDAMTMSVLQERGMSRAQRKQIQQSQGGQGLSSFADNLRDNPRTGGFMGRFTEAYASNDQDAMKELVKQGLKRAGMSAKQINNIDPKLLDTATAGLMTTLSGLQAKFREKGFDMGKALAKGLKDSMVNLANAKDDLEYNAKKALGQANFGDSVGLIFRRMFRGTVATQGQFAEMYNQMGSGVKKLMFKNPKEGDEMFPNILQFVGSITTTLAPITTMIGAITPLLLPLAPIITGIGMAVNMVAPHVAKLIDGIQRVEVLQRRFKFLGGSKEGGKAEFNYAKDIATKLNVPSEVAANSYSQLAIAAKDSKMEGQGVKELFEGITSSLSALGINGQDASLVFTAYTQILAKGKLSMEELRQQLGEKFPPAMAMFAKAMGVTVPEMNELVASGGILSQDILPKVAKVLKEDYGSAAADQAGGLVVALNRLGNVGFEITTIFTDKIGGTLAFFVNTFANILGVLSGALKELIPLAQSFMIGFAATISIGLTIILSKFGPLRVAIGSLQNFLLATFSAITTNMMPMVVGVVSDVADGWLGAEKNLIENMFQGIANMFVTMFSAIDTAMRSMSDNKVSFSSLFGGLIQGAEQAGSIIDWLKGVFAGFFKILPSGIVEILAIVFMLEQGTGLMVMALWPAITKLWGGITGIFGATAKAFYGVMGSLKAVVELMMTSSAVAANATNNVAASGVKSMAIVQGALGFLSKALLHFGLAYAVLMFSKGDFSDPLRESINKSTADINKHLNQVRLNIGQTTEAFNKATKSVEKLGNTITNALPAKGVQLDIRSLWGGGDYKWDDAVRDTNAKYRPGGTGASAMDFLGPVALGLGGAGIGIAAKVAAASAANAASAAVAAKAFTLGTTVVQPAAVGIISRILAMLAPMLASPLAPWIAAIAGLIAAIGLATVALDAFAPKITEAQLEELPEEIKQIINAKKVGERLDSASLQVIKLYKDQELSNQRLKEFMASIGLDGTRPYSFVARPVVPMTQEQMTQEQKQKFESETPVQNITKRIEDKRASLQELEKLEPKETEKSKARSKEGYKKVQEEVTQLEKDKLLMQLSFMANLDNKPKMDALNNDIAKQKLVVDELRMREAQLKKEEMQYSFFGRPSFSGTSQKLKYAKDGQTYKEESQKLEKLKKEKAALQANIDASAQRRVNYDAIKEIDVDIEKASAEFVEASNQLAVNPNDKLRQKAGLAKERILQLQKRRQKLVDEFGDPTPSIKQALEVNKKEIEKTLSDLNLTPQQRKVTVKQLKERQETLQKSLAEAQKFSVAPIADTMYTQAIAALKDNEVKSNIDISKNKIVSNQAQAKLYSTTLTSQQIAPSLSDRQIADLTFQQKVLERSLKIKEDNLFKLQQAEAQSPTNLSQIQEEIVKLQQEIAKDREQVSQNTLEIVKTQREARQALIDQTKQVAEYYRTSLRESKAAAIEFDKATNNIKSQQFATKLKQALVGAGNNIFTNFIDSVIGLFQQLTEIENLRLDRQKQKLDYENNIQDILIKVTEMQRSLPGKIVPFDVGKIRDFDKELRTVNKSVSSINKEVNNVANGIGVSAVNSTINLNKALQDLLKTLQDINKNPLNPTAQPFNNSSSSNTPVGVSQRTKIPVTHEDEQIWREFVAPQSGIKRGTSSLPTSTPVANALKEVLVAGLMSDIPVQLYANKPKDKNNSFNLTPFTSPIANQLLTPNTFVSPIANRSLADLLNTRYGVQELFGYRNSKGLTLGKNAGVSRGSDVVASLGGTAFLEGNTLKIAHNAVDGKIVYVIYQGLNPKSITKNLGIKGKEKIEVSPGQLIGNPSGDKFKFGIAVGEPGKVTQNPYKNPLTFVRDIYRANQKQPMNPLQWLNRTFINRTDPVVNSLGLTQYTGVIKTSNQSINKPITTTSTPPVNQAIDWVKGKVKGFVRQNAPEPVKRVIRNTKNFVDNIPPIIPTYNQNTNSYNPGILDILIGNNSKPKPKPNNSTGSSRNNQSTGNKPTTTNQSKSGSGTNQGTDKKLTPTNQGNVPNLSSAFPQPSTGGLTLVSNTRNQIPPDLSSAFPSTPNGIKLTNASTSGNNNQGNNQDKLLVSPIPGKTLADILKFPYTDNEKKDGAYYGSARGVNRDTQLKAPISGKATLYIYKDKSNEDLTFVDITKNINGKQIIVRLTDLSLDSIKKNLGNLKHQSSFSLKAGQPIGTPQENRSVYMTASVQGKDLTIVDFIKNSQSYGFSPQGLTATPKTTPPNTGNLPQIPQTKQPVVIPPGTDPYTRSQLENQPLKPGNLQPGVESSGKLSLEAKKKQAAAEAAKNRAEIQSKLIEFQRTLANLLRDTNKSIRDESLQAAQDINNASEYIQGLLNPNASDKEKFATDFQKLKTEYQAKINEQENIIESAKVPLAELARVDELIAAAQREGIDASGLKTKRDEVYRVVKVREQTAIKLRKMYIDNKNKVFDTYVDRFKEEQLNKDAERRANLLGVNISQLKLQLEELKGIQAIDPLNPGLLKIPDLEANIAELELTQTTLQKIAALRREWQQSGGKNMSQEVFKKRAEDIMNTVTKQTGIIDRKRQTDKISAYVNRELGLIDKGAAEREPITKGLQLDNSLFAASNKNGLVNIINFENEALIKQKELMDSYRKNSLEAQLPQSKLTLDEQITKRLRNAMNLQKELEILKIETEYQKATGEIKNRQVTVDVQVKLSDAAKAIFESKSTIKKNLGLELAGERLDRQNAITAQENEYKRKQNETDQFILDNKLTDPQADELRRNNQIENDSKIRAIESQFSELAQIMKSFVSGFKNSFKEFLLSTEDTGTALLNLAKGIGKSVLDTLAEMASKRVTDLLFGWMGGTGLNPASELSFAAQQLTQAAYALQNVGRSSSIADVPDLDVGSLGGFAGFGDIASFSPTGMEFLDPSAFTAADFGSASLSGFAKGGMIDKDTLGKIQNFANGGIVGTMNKERAMTGRTPHLVVASEGERILNHKETAIWNKLQTGISGFADGGVVGGGSGDIASKIGGSTTTVNVPVSVSVNEGSDVDGARLSQTVQALVSDGIRREMRPGGSIRRGNPYGR